MVVQEICPGIYSHGSLDVMLQIGILSRSGGSTRMVDSSFLKTVQISNIHMSSRYLWSLYLISLGYVLSPTGKWRPWRMDGI